MFIKFLENIANDGNEFVQGIVETLKTRPLTDDERLFLHDVVIEYYGL